MSEKSALLLSMFSALLIGCIAIFFAITSNSRAILLDGLFNLCYFVISIFTLKVMYLSQRPDDLRYPFGYGYFESMNNGIKGVFIFAICILALIDALIAISRGGRFIDINDSITYAIAASLICAITTYCLYRANKKSASPLIKADIANWLVNSLISIAVLSAFIMMWLLEHFQFDRYIAYVDPILVVVVILFSLTVPVMMIRQAAGELLNTAPESAVQKPIHECIQSTLKDYPIVNHYFRMVRIGRKNYATLHVIFANERSNYTLAELDEIRQSINAHIIDSKLQVCLDIIFTTHEKWAQPG